MNVSDEISAAAVRMLSASGTLPRFFPMLPLGYTPEHCNNGGRGLDSRDFSTSKTSKHCGVLNLEMPSV